jgi:hypothetical protein
MVKIFGGKVGSPEQILKLMKKMCEEHNKPIALSFFAERRYIEEFKSINTFPLFNDSVESVRALRMLRDYWQGREKVS